MTEGLTRLASYVCIWFGSQRAKNCSSMSLSSMEGAAVRPSGVKTGRRVVTDSDKSVKCRYTSLACHQSKPVQNTGSPSIGFPLFLCLCFNMLFLFHTCPRSQSGSISVFSVSPFIPSELLVLGFGGESKSACSPPLSLLPETCGLSDRPGRQMRVTPSP